MEPLMNAPQWFLEREDSAELIALLRINYEDPVQELNRLSSLIKGNYLVIYELSGYSHIRTYTSLEKLETEMTKKIQKELVRCIYDIKNDQYIPISVCLAVGRQNGK